MPSYDNLSILDSLAILYIFEIFTNLNFTFVMPLIKPKCNNDPHGIEETPPTKNWNPVEGLVGASVMP